MFILSPLDAKRHLAQTVVKLLVASHISVLLDVKLRLAQTYVNLLVASTIHIDISL